jgi:hypothetical protein
VKDFLTAAQPSSLQSLDTTREQTLPVATVKPVLFLCQADHQLSAQHVSSEPLCVKLETPKLIIQCTDTHTYIYLQQSAILESKLLLC